MKKQNIEDIFSSMEDFSSVPPPELWGEIEKKLDKPKKKKRVILWWSAAACLLLGLLLPSVLHFTSNSGIKTINNGSTENNSVVLDEKKNELNTKTLPTQETDSGQIPHTKESIANENVPPLKSNEKQFDNSQKVQSNKTTVAHSDTKNNNNSDITNLKSNTAKSNINKPVTEKTQVAATEKVSVSDQKNGFNTGSQIQIANTDKKTASKTLPEKAFITSKSNSFNTSSAKQVANADKKASDKILAEKTFAVGNVNPFNSTSKNQISKSVFEDKQISKNNNNIALNGANLNSTQRTILENKAKENSSGLISEKQIANNQKSNSKFNNVLSKQDSVQLAELQNLEKGIVTNDDKKETDKKPLSNAEKWAVEVFAGVANSENYKNDKTLGNANDSKQSNSYGVKTKYKITKKWAVASGLKINELGQSVANVSYLNAKNNTFFSSSDYFNQKATADAAPHISTNDSYVFVPNTTSDALKQNGIQSNNMQTGNLDQNLRYLEMPLEVSYAIFSRNKASINLNTGGFIGKLISNNVALDGSSIGENVNANDFVYGSTLSSTIQYRVYKKTNVFVEPAMNYYVNPLSNQSFNQFQWGLNFGLNVSF
ncbi:hypothetical protein ACQKCJ_11380 [Flavobacterium sp. NPDC079362]|uniref:hypothetical protein n=1 Tax=Flavobacterium sp. NPDC079362 TaxID=3390566 RepID=UPI003D0593A0